MGRGLSLRPLSAAVLPMGNETVQLIVLGACAIALAGLAGAGALYLLRRRSLRWQAAAVALTAVLAVAGGAWAAAQAMFVSP